MKRRALVHVFHPGNALGALCSPLWLGRAEGLPPAEVSLVLANPCADPQTLPIMADILERLVSGQGWPRPRIVGESDVRAILGGHGPDGAEPAARFKRHMETLTGKDGFEEVHYVHEVSGPIVQLALNAYPGARAVTFGDALGSLNNAGYHKALYDGLPHGQCVAAGRNYSLDVKESRIPQAGTVVAALPTDQTGDCLEGKRLHAVPRETVLEVIRSAAPSLAELERHCSLLLAELPEPRFLVLMESIDQSGFASPENTLALQEEIIARAAPPGSGIVIKPHPLSTSDLHLELARRLKERYRAVCLDPAFQRYPVEFMTGLIGNCRPVCWSYGTLSLSFLTGGILEHAIDEGLVRRYIEPGKRNSMLNSMLLVTGPLARLAAWDRSGPLWTGGYETLDGGKQ